MIQLFLPQFMASLGDFLNVRCSKDISYSNIYLYHSNAGSEEVQ